MVTKALCICDCNPEGHCAIHHTYRGLACEVWFYQKSVAQSIIDNMSN